MIVQLPEEAQAAALLQNKRACYRQMANDDYSLTGLFCNRTWDNVMCWPDTPAGSIVYQSCPSYINGFNTEQNASRLCLPNGTWFVHSSVNGSSSSGWTNFIACFANITTQDHPEDEFDLGVANMVRVVNLNLPPFDFMSQSLESQLPLIKHMNEFRLMYNIGYALSLVCLLLAVAIMLYFRRLHCARNAIHLNLFLAFILRALMSTIKENLFVGGLGFAGDVGYTENNTMYFKEGSHWECRLFFSLFQYVLTASYIWIFVEGLYLHMLIFVSVFTEKTRILWYMVFGWSLPVPFVLAWAISRFLLDNTLCWNTSTNSVGLTWIMKGPVMLSIVLNFLFFISIVRVLFTKLTSSHCPESKRLRYRRLARSTLVLIPIFGVYYIVFTFPLDNLDDTTSFILLFIEMFFNSYQGVIITIVLCFVNAEVRGEIKKAWHRLEFRRDSAISMNHSQYRVPRQSKDIQNSESCNMDDYSRKKKKKKRGCLKNDTSFTNFEETLPLNTVTNANDVIQREEPNPSESNNPHQETWLNDTSDALNADVKVQINTFNFQRSSKEDTENALSSLHIDLLQNGTKLSETQHINNNRGKAQLNSFNDTKRFALEHEKTILAT